MADVPKIAIIVLNWNGHDDTLECLRSLEAVSYANFEVIAVDNGSIDGSVQALKETFPTLTVLENGENLGYAGGNNVGIHAALERGAEFILLLNNDTVVAPNILDEFVAGARRFPNAAALGGKIYRYADPERIWWADAHWVEDDGRFICPSEGALDSATMEDGATKTDYVCGCAIFLRAGLIHEVGLLDVQYFLTFEETDWCFRVRRIGYDCLLIPTAKIWHKGSASFKGEESPLYSYFFTRNRLLFAERHLGARARAIVWRKTVGQFVTWALASLPRFTAGSWKQSYWTLRVWWSSPGFRATRLAIRDYLLRRFGDCPAIVRELR